MEKLNAFGRLWAWLSLQDYEAADRSATVQVVQRYSRGNTSVQDGRFLTSDEMAIRALAMSKRLPAMIRRYAPHLARG